MEAKRIKVIKDWPELKSVCNIQVFLDFANFYRQFIQSFSKIAILLTSILKTTGLLDKLAFSKNNGSRSASSRNNNSRLAFRRNDNDIEVDRFGIGRNGMEHTKKSGKMSKSRKLSKLGKSKGEKMSKS